MREQWYDYAEIVWVKKAGAQKKKWQMTSAWTTQTDEYRRTNLSRWLSRNAQTDWPYSPMNRKYPPTLMMATTSGKSSFVSLAGSI